MKLSLIVPTYNEAPNVKELVRRTAEACHGVEAEMVFIDDSTDHTPKVIAEVAAVTDFPVRMIHRQTPVGGLGGAVIEGISSSSAQYCLVMDGDLQHPPSMIPVILAQLESSQADVVVASRYGGGGGSAGGLENGFRRLVSSGCTFLTRGMFPVRLRHCTDPMTGFFGFRRTSVHVGGLRPTGFKILLEILARQPLKVAEVPFVFGERFAGESKASMSEGMRFVRQLAGLRVGRIGRFAVVGAIGTVLNLLIMAILLGSGVHYAAAAVVAAETTIVSNFLMQERFVFGRIQCKTADWRRRFLQSFSFNNVEAGMRLLILILFVEILAIPSLLGQAGTLAGAFILRYAYHTRVVYRTRPAIVYPSAVPLVHPPTPLIQEVLPLVHPANPSAKPVVRQVKSDAG